MASTSKGLNENQILDFLDLIDPNNSDMESDGDEDDEDLTQPDLQHIQNHPSDDESSSDDEPLQVDTAVARMRSERWRHKDEFFPPPLVDPGTFVLPDDLEVKEPFEYFSKYIDETCFEEMANFMNRRYVEFMGKSLNTTSKEIKTFWGASIVLHLLGFPRIRMCWKRRTRYPLVSENIARDRFYLLRNNIKVTDDNAVTAEQKADRFWKVRPFSNRIRDACLKNLRTKEVSIDEQMIPFHGHVVTRHYVKGKPNPVGMKNFVTATPNGLPLDFYLYEGKGKEILAEKVVVPEKMDIGGRVTLKLADTLPSGSSIFMDRYFTSVNLIDILRTQCNIFSTGIIMVSRLPKSGALAKDKDLRKQALGAHDLIIREDDTICNIKWFDNRPIHLSSSQSLKSRYYITLQSS